MHYLINIYLFYLMFVFSTKIKEYTQFEYFVLEFIINELCQ